MIISWCLNLFWTSFLKDHFNYDQIRDDYDILIWTLHPFLNRSFGAIMGHCYNRNQTGFVKKKKEKQTKRQENYCTKRQKQKA